MSNLNNSSKYIFKAIVIIIVVVINIIALIGVVTTVSRTVKELKVNISTGKISKESSGNKIDVTQEEEMDSLDSAYSEDESEIDLDFGSLFKKAIKDKEVLKSIVLMAIALILLAGAIFVLIKLK